MSNTEKWSDLTARVWSALVMVVFAAIGIWAGGHVFHILVALIVGLMVWELVDMITPPERRNISRILGSMTGVALLAAAYLPVGFALPLLLAPALVGFGQLERNRTIYMTFTVMIVLSGFGMMQVRDDMGVEWMLWLVLVVVVTDVVGYFAGRAIGGPKFWPKVSPKKTWSGTAAGWVGAGIVGFLFSVNTGVGLQLIGISVAVSMASQMGDIAESGMKRKMGVKDSSNLIPGHGGLMDRFDGMLGASVFLLIIGQFIGFPPGVG
ncbi:phosphatidate cytidylyltransferase [Sulfitobacter guttiformis]|uniref:Phosphatidate cytidylyltransferase n=1 Tax=Sulfitobacter guttiformis TaxID=74349 RepID=A0A420DIC3_9RHOB|nr:phosphatidate cytidylyltransferase [Sulfitobacter guttiformis]KIN72272.1 Phosphatidate cytidylyltransferase [Sulfitobacter guttiformis KCTC 32187]RKE93962.1 phosphatidate cytidylyltransferase [Sulfitobacter guttiformis]